MEKSGAKLDIDAILPYVRNTNVFFEGIESGFLDRAAKKLSAVSNRLLRRRCAPVFSERIVETPLVFQRIPRDALNILDFGCATSLQSMQLCALGHTVTGLDFQSYPFVHKNFRFIQADILEWKPEPETFDMAISISTVEHVGLGEYGDPVLEGGDKIAVDKLRDSLKTGGTMLLTVPAGKKCVRRGMRIYDPQAVESLVSDIEQVRYFRKAKRFSDWEEVPASEIEGLTYENYETIAPAQGVAFIVSRKT